MTIVFKISDNIKPKMIKYYEALKRDKTELKHFLNTKIP